MKPAKSYVYSGSILIVLMVVLVWWSATNREHMPADSTSETAHVTAPSQPDTQLKFASQGQSADSEAPALPAARPEIQQVRQPAASVMTRTEVEFDAAINDIDGAATSYDAEELPVLEYYLYDQDPEIRKAALDGMLILGDKAASPLLRKAAENAYSPHEAVAMLEAADYLELPSGKLPPIDKNAVESKGQKPSNSKPLNVNELFRRTGSSAATQ